MEGHVTGSISKVKAKKTEGKKGYPRIARIYPQKFPCDNNI